MGTVPVRSNLIWSGRGVLGRLAFACLAVMLVAGCGRSGESTDVLLIGNSHIESNDLPGMLEQFAESGGHPVSVSSVTADEDHLSDHVESPNTIAMLRRGGWEYVVLQEQSVLPGIRSERSRAMLPAVRTLAREASVYRAEPVLLLTWGWDDDLESAGFRDYSHMQKAVTEGSRRIADATGVRISPVGEAWSQARRSGASLYQPDGRHPDVTGTYLAAAVLYATLFDADPRLVDFDGGLGDEVAAALRGYAGAVAYDEREQWLAAPK